MASHRCHYRIFALLIVLSLWLQETRAWALYSTIRVSHGRRVTNTPRLGRQHSSARQMSQRPTRRFLSSVGQSTSSRSRPRDKVVYQKVLQSRDEEFITTLVDHLEGFQLPSDLPMIYEARIPDAPADTEDLTTPNPPIVEWDSPLSPTPDATRMKIQLVAIAASNEDSDKPQSTNSPQTFPMTMIIVQKNAQAHSSMPPMMKNLFDDSEKRILKSLDRSLQDFVQNYSSQAVKTAQKQKLLQQTMLEEILDDIVDSPQETLKSTISPVDPQSQEVRRAVLETMQQPAVIPESPSSRIDTVQTGDFAIQAARNIAEKQRPSSQNDFAVASAKRAASKAAKITPRKMAATAQRSITADDESLTATEACQGDSGKEFMRPASMLNRANQSLPMLRNKRCLSISTPADFAARRNNLQKELVESSDNQIGLPSTSSDTSSTPARLVADDRVKSEAAEVGAIEDSVYDEIERTVDDAIAEMSGKDISPEELLKNVMQFGDQQEQVFATQALEKAKDLLRKQREESEHVREIKEKTMENLVAMDLSVEEELRQMFQAGEKLADTKIAIVKEESPLADANKRLVDSVIAEDKSGMPNYARSLDEDLVELATRLNKSPGEDMDGPRKYPVFDVFSGPEVYNMNVDPETAVNWPGALPSLINNNKIPKDLQSAVSNARFAVDVLMRLQEKDSRYFIGQKELTREQVRNLQVVVDEAIEIGLIPDPVTLESEKARLRMVIDELWGQPDERVGVIAANYKELLLSDNFPAMMRERLDDIASRDIEALREDDEMLKQALAREREILGSLVVYAQLLLKETRALGAQLEASHLEIIRSICKVAMDPAHQTEDDTAMALTDAVREMRPLFDDSFVAYLKFAVAEEEGRLARAGLLDDPDHNQWLFILKIVQQGVYAELGKGLSRYIDHIMYVLRMETANERTMLLKKLIDVMPTLDVRPFVRVVDSIVGSLGDSVNGNFGDANELGEMTNRLLQLRRDVNRLLPPERIALMSKDADDWAAKQKERLLKNREISMQRLRAAEETEYIEGEMDSLVAEEIDRVE